MDCSALCRGRHRSNGYTQIFWEERLGEIMKEFEDGSLSFTCDEGEQSEGEMEKEFVKDLKESLSCEYRFYKTPYGRPECLEM